MLPGMSLASRLMCVSRSLGPLQRACEAGSVCARTSVSRSRRWAPSTGHKTELLRELSSPDSHYQDRSPLKDPIQCSSAGGSRDHRCALDHDAPTTTSPGRRALQSSRRRFPPTCAPCAAQALCLSDAGAVLAIRAARAASRSEGGGRSINTLLRSAGRGSRSSAEIVWDDSRSSRRP